MPTIALSFHILLLLCIIFYFREKLVNPSLVVILCKTRLIPLFTVIHLDPFKTTKQQQKVRPFFYCDNIALFVQWASFVKASA